MIFAINQLIIVIVQDILLCDLQCFNAIQSIIIAEHCSDCSLSAADDNSTGSAIAVTSHAHLWWSSEGKVNEWRCLVLRRRVEDEIHAKVVTNHYLWLIARKFNYYSVYVLSFQYCNSWLAKISPFTQFFPRDACQTAVNKSGLASLSIWQIAWRRLWFIVADLADRHPVSGWLQFVSGQ